MGVPAALLFAASLGAQGPLPSPNSPEASFLLGGVVGLGSGSNGFASRFSVTVSHRVGDFYFTMVESSREISSSVSGIPLVLMEFESLDDFVSDYALLYGRHLGDSLRGWARVAAGPALVRSGLRASQCTGVFIFAGGCESNDQEVSWTIGLASQLDLLVPVAEAHAVGLMFTANANSLKSFASVGAVYSFFIGF